jgi:hypothetical protein
MLTVGILASRQSSTVSSQFISSQPLVAAPTTTG